MIIFIVFTLHLILLRDYMKEDEVSGTRNMQGEKKYKKKNWLESLMGRLRL